MIVRHATLDDCRRIFDWSNDELVRSQSYQSDPIIWENHVKWYEHQMSQPEKSVFYICETEDNQPIGLVRFSKMEDHWIIGVLIDQDQRGKGWSPKVILAGCSHLEKLAEEVIYAYIKEQNIASIKSFERAGFVLTSKLLYQKQPSFLYEWK